MAEGLALSSVTHGWNRAGIFFGSTSVQCIAFGSQRTSLFSHSWE